MEPRNFKTKILVILVALVAAVFTFKVTDYFADKKLEKERVAVRKLKIKNDSLVEVSDGHYRKLVADTLTIKELRQEVKDLEFKVEDPIIVEKIVLVPEEKETEIDSIGITKDSISFVDYYPQKEGFFVKYGAQVSFRDSTGVGKFSFGELPISLVISEKEDGTYQTDLKAPDFIKLSSLDIQSLPLTPPKKDNFGFLVGGKVNKTFGTGELGYEIIGGLRIKKLNIISSINTNTQFGIGALIEL